MISQRSDLRFRKHYGFAFVTSLFLVLTCAQAATAQLRQGPKRPDISTDPNDDRPTPSKGTPLQLIAADFIPSSNFAFHTEIAFRSFVERLQESGFVTVSEKKDTRRKDAADLARRSENTFVAWLQLEIEMGGNDVAKDSEKAAIAPINPGCLYVTYEVFAPKTGKTVKQGHEYQPGYEDRCVGGVYRSSPYPRYPFPRNTTPELSLKKAGRVAADRIMTAFKIPLPPQP